MVALKIRLVPATVKVILVPTFTIEVYFSGTEKVIFTGLILTKLAIGVVGVMYAPFEIFLNPIRPEKGALIDVLDSCALINCVCAFSDLNSASALSYSS